MLPANTDRGKGRISGNIVIICMREIRRAPSPPTLAGLHALRAPCSARSTCARRMQPHTSCSRLHLPCTPALWMSHASPPLHLSLIHI
eukprot:7145106-Prorocentrum_lima.AAC.1